MLNTTLRVYSAPLTRAHHRRLGPSHPPPPLPNQSRRAPMRPARRRRHSQEAPWRRRRRYRPIRRRPGRRRRIQCTSMMTVRMATWRMCSCSMRWSSSSTTRDELLYISSSVVHVLQIILTSVVLYGCAITQSRCDTPFQYIRRFQRGALHCGVCVGVAGCPVLHPVDMHQHTQRADRVVESVYMYVCMRELRCWPLAARSRPHISALTVLARQRHGARAAMYI